MWKRVAAVVASLVVSGVFLWLALRDIPMAEVWGSIQQAQLTWVVAAVLSGVVAIWTRAVRWSGLLSGQITVRRSFYIYGITQFMNLLPFRMGEVARTILAARERVPIVTTASSIVVERLLDLVFVLGMLVIIVPQVDDLPASVVQSVTTFSVLAIAAFVVLLVLARYPDFAQRILNMLQSRIPMLERLPLDTLLDNALDGLRPLVDLNRFLHAVLWTFISWFFSWLIFYVSGLGLGIAADAILFHMMGLSLAAFAVAVPLTVGAVGPFQAGVIVAGAAFGVSEVLATAEGFMVHGLTILSYVICGTWGFLALGVRFVDVTQADKERRSDDADQAEGVPSA
jgi:uncharacterized protein (TIRG00374 family)